MMMVMAMVLMTVMAMVIVQRYLSAGMTTREIAAMDRTDPGAAIGQGDAAAAMEAASHVHSSSAAHAHSAAAPAPASASPSAPYQRHDAVIAVANGKRRKRSRHLSRAGKHPCDKRRRRKCCGSENPENLGAHDTILLFNATNRKQRTSPAETQ
jgi:hypothetical protein